MQVKELLVGAGTESYAGNSTLKQRDGNEEKEIEHSNIQLLQHNVLYSKAHYIWKHGISCVLICWYKDLKRNELSFLQVHNMNFMNSWFN